MAKTSTARLPRPAKGAGRVVTKRDWQRIKILLCDVDGILTDASIYMGGGVENKRFNIRDGLGLRLLQRSGVKVGWISNRPSPATTQRAEDLKVDILFQAAGSKVSAIEQILRDTGLAWGDVCYMGDDIVDLGALRRAGVSVTVPDAVAEAKAAARYVTRLPGGHGAVREVVQLILEAQGKWRQIVEEHGA